MDDMSWKKIVRANWSSLTKELVNPDEVADYLLYEITPSMLSEDSVRKIKDMDSTNREKTRYLLNTLMYKGSSALEGLVKALCGTGNQELAKLLKPDLDKFLESQRKALHQIKVWPPTHEELEEMNKSEPERCDLSYLSKDYSNSKEVFPMKSERRGLAVIINNSEFQQTARMSYREGSNYDKDRLARVLSQLHFDVRVYENKTSFEIREIASETSKPEHHKGSDCFVFCIMSHGHKSAVYGTDGFDVHIDNLASKYNQKSCLELTGKPKLFIIQACRTAESSRKSTTIAQTSDSKDTSANGPSNGDSNSGDFSDVTTTDTVCVSPPSSEPRQDVNETKPVAGYAAADFFYAFATPEGFEAYRSHNKGSWFIQSLVWALKYEAHKGSMEDLMSTVNKYVSTAKTTKRGKEVGTVSEKRSTLTKNFYFFPGVCGNPPKKNTYKGKIDIFK